MKFTLEIRQQIDSELHPHLDQFERMLAWLASRSQRELVVGAPEELHARFNYFVDLLEVLHVRKFLQLGQALVAAIDTENYLIYGTLGRAAIEFGAVLRYYTRYKIRPLVQSSAEWDLVPLETLAEVIHLLEKQLRGTRYDWKDFFGRYIDRTHDIKQAELYKQVNVLTCLEKWIKEDAEIGRYYSLFCDLVHPNLGSSLMLASLHDSFISIGVPGGRPFGAIVFEQTFANLVRAIEESLAELAELEALRFHPESQWPSDV